jgi:hypothetical protein
MIFNLCSSMYFTGINPPTKNAKFVKIYGEGETREGYIYSEGEARDGFPHGVPVGENVSEWTIEIDTLEELLALRDEAGFALVVTLGNNIVIYDGFLE